MYDALQPEIALSAAYMGLGFAPYAEEVTHLCSKKHTSQLEILEALSENAIILERLYHSLPEDLRDEAPGVWAYEVAEEFGGWFGRAAIINEGLFDRGNCRVALCRIVAEFFAACDAKHPSAGWAPTFEVISNIVKGL